MSHIGFRTCHLQPVQYFEVNRIMHHFCYIKGCIFGIQDIRFFTYQIATCKLSKYDQACATCMYMYKAVADSLANEKRL